jgi:hypothetical protein
MAEYTVSASRTRPPMQPGEILREDVLPRLKLSVSAAARMGNWRTVEILLRSDARPASTVRCRLLAPRLEQPKRAGVAV